jgi:hypothetical protein
MSPRALKEFKRLFGDKISYKMDGRAIEFDYKKLQRYKQPDLFEARSNVERFARGLSHTAGWSYPVGQLFVAVWGKQPFNRDVMDAIYKTPVTFKDDDGETHTDNTVVRISDHRTGRSLNRIQEKKGFEQETVLVLSIPKGSEKSVEAGLKKVLRPFQLKMEMLPRHRSPGVRQKDKLVTKTGSVRTAKGLPKPDSSRITDEMWEQMKNAVQDNLDALKRGGVKILSLGTGGDPARYYAFLNYKGDRFHLGIDNLKKPGSAKIVLHHIPAIIKVADQLIADFMKTDQPDIYHYDLQNAVKAMPSKTKELYNLGTSPFDLVSGILRMRGRGII